MKPGNLARIAMILAPSKLFDNMQKTNLVPLYNGAVKVSPNCLKDPAIMAALESLSKRNWQAYPSPAGVWNISDRH